MSNIGSSAFCIFFRICHIHKLKLPLVQVGTSVAGWDEPGAAWERKSPKEYRSFLYLVLTSSCIPHQLCALNNVWLMLNNVKR